MWSVILAGVKVSGKTRSVEGQARNGALLTSATAIH